MLRRRQAKLKTPLLPSGAWFRRNSLNVLKSVLRGDHPIPGSVAHSRTWLERHAIQPSIGLNGRTSHLSRFGGSPSPHERIVTRMGGDRLFQPGSGRPSSGPTRAVSGPLGTDLARPPLLLLNLQQIQPQNRLLDLPQRDLGNFLGMMAIGHRGVLRGLQRPHLRQRRARLRATR